MRTLASLVCATWLIGASACSVVPEPMRFPQTNRSDPESGAPLQEQPGQTPPPEQTPPPPPGQQPPPTSGSPSTRSPSEARANEGIFVEPGIGFTADPDTFLLGLTAGKFLNRNVAIGPMLQLGVSDDDTIFAPTLNVRGVFDLEGQGLESVKPYAEGGLGLCYIDKDNHPGDNDEWGFLINFGFGANVEVQRNLVLGTGFVFNFLPSEVVDEHFFFSWRILQLSLYF